MVHHLIFNSDIGKQKPHVMKNPSITCPFCEVDHLTDILDSDGDIILLKNKYPVLKEAYQTVLIETSECQSELSIYQRHHLHRVIDFGLNHWLDYERSGDYKSVLFFKNHGPLSGGTIRHPHMQIVGLTSVDYRDDLKDDDFEGISFIKEADFEANVSTKPRIGFTEFNVIIKSVNQSHQMADVIQVITHYILNDFNAYCDSYNLFFYDYHGMIICKIIPRFATSPIYIGYGIPQVSTGIQKISAILKEKIKTMI